MTDEGRKFKQRRRDARHVIKVWKREVIRGRHVLKYGNRSMPLCFRLVSPAIKKIVDTMPGRVLRSKLFLYQFIQRRTAEQWEIAHYARRRNGWMDRNRRYRSEPCMK